MKVVSIVPARGGSKAIPDKNIKELNGVPLVCNMLSISIDSKVNETWLSTDSIRISDVVRNYFIDTELVNILMRPSKIADDKSSTEKVLIHFAEHVDFDVLLLLQCTSPLTTPEDINRSIDMMSEYDSVVSVCENKGGWLCGGFSWKKSIYGAIPEYDLLNRPMRQMLRQHYLENGALYMTTREQLLNSGCRLGGRIGLYEMPRNRSFEIDEPADLYEIKRFMETA